MKSQIESLLRAAWDHLVVTGKWSHPRGEQVIAVTGTKDPTHGDFATNLALLLAKPLGISPRVCAENLRDALPSVPFVKRVEIAGPGFLNFFVEESGFFEVIPTILQQKAAFGQSQKGHGIRVHIEYVSANPTGPLHVGHGRGAAYGACVSNLLRAVGYHVHREYYVNDAGRQMRILALSTWLRYIELLGESVVFPENGYRGDYIIDIARAWVSTYERQFYRAGSDIAAALHALPESIQADQEARLDAYIEIAQRLLAADFQRVQALVMEAILADIRDDLAEFGVTYDEWFHESQLFEKGWVDEGIQLLTAKGHTYQKEGALWFRATTFGDEKDRVLVRENGISTYFASDVAYHLYKYRQGYHRVIDVFGADHHGYISRIRAFLSGLGENPDQLTILLVQFAVLYRGQEKVSMSTRSGEFVTLRALRDEVGCDAARYFYVARRPEQHLDFDLELAKSQSSDNPVYYIQYAHARIMSVFRQAGLAGEAVGAGAAVHLTLPLEKTNIYSND